MELILNYVFGILFLVPCPKFLRYMDDLKQRIKEKMQAGIRQRVFEERWIEYEAEVQTCRDYIARVEEGMEPVNDRALEIAHQTIAEAVKAPDKVSKFFFWSRHLLHIITIRRHHSDQSCSLIIHHRRQHGHQSWLDWPPSNQFPRTKNRVLNPHLKPIFLQAFMKARRFDVTSYQHRRWEGFGEVFDMVTNRIKDIMLIQCFHRWKRQTGMWWKLSCPLGCSFHINEIVGEWKKSSFKWEWNTSICRAELPTSRN